MKAIKTISWALFVVVAIAIGAAVFLFSNLNQIIKEAVETVGPEVTETRVLLNKVDVKPLDGSGQLNNFTIANPSGFTSKNAFELDQLVLSFDPKSVADEVIVINDIIIKGMQVNAEQKGTSTNLQQLLKTVQKKAGASEGAPNNSSDASGSNVKLIIKNIEFADNAISLISEQFGQYDIALPAFQLSDIGKKENGLTPEQLGTAIAEPLLKQAEKAIKRKIEGLTKEKIEQKIREEREKLKQKAKAKEAELKEDLNKKEKELKKDVESKLKDELGEDAEEKLKDLKNIFN